MVPACGETARAIVCVGTPADQRGISAHPGVSSRLADLRFEQLAYGVERGLRRNLDEDADRARGERVVPAEHAVALVETSDHEEQLPLLALVLAVDLIVQGES